MVKNNPDYETGECLRRKKFKVLFKFYRIKKTWVRKFNTFITNNYEYFTRLKNGYALLFITSETYWTNCLFWWVQNTVMGMKDRSFTVASKKLRKITYVKNIISRTTRIRDAKYRSNAFDWKLICSYAEGSPKTCERNSQEENAKPMFSFYFGYIFSNLNWMPLSDRVPFSLTFIWFFTNWNCCKANS